MSFASPYVLFGLLAVPLAALAYLVAERGRERRAETWSSRALQPNLFRRPSPRRRRVPAALFLLALTFLLVGFARPERMVGTGRGTATVVLAFDVSGSMDANDVPPTRIGAARRLAIGFLNELPAAYRVAVVTFGNKVSVVVPPTLDRATVSAHLPAQVTPRTGTALGDAISESVAIIGQAFGTSQEGGRPGAILLLSDGAATAGGTSITAAALTARAFNVPIDTVAIGTPTGSVTQTVKLNVGESSLTLPAPVDDSSLQLISGVSEGTFFGTASTAQLATVYKHLQPRISVSGSQSTHELSWAAGGLALLFILAGIGISGLWYGKVA